MKNVEALGLFIESHDTMRCRNPRTVIGRLKKAMKSWMLAKSGLGGTAKAAGEAQGVPRHDGEALREADAGGAGANRRLKSIKTYSKSIENGRKSYKIKLKTTFSMLFGAVSLHFPTPPSLGDPETRAAPDLKSYSLEVSMPCSSWKGSKARHWPYFT